MWIRPCGIMCLSWAWFDAFILHRLSIHLCFYNTPPTHSSLIYTRYLLGYCNTDRYGSHSTSVYSTITAAYVPSVPYIVVPIKVCCEETRLRYWNYEESIFIIRKFGRYWREQQNQRAKLSSKLCRTPIITACKVANFQLHRIITIRIYLTTETIKIIVQTLLYHTWC